MTLDPFADNRAPIDRATNAIGPEPTPTPTTTGHTWWNWTPQEVRGLPAVPAAKGLAASSAIAGTQPGHNLDHWPHPDQDAA